MPGSIIAMKDFSLPIFVIVLLAIAVQSCGDDGICCPPPPSMDVSISYVHEDGSDLLGQDTASLEEFSIYYLQINDETEEFEREPAATNQYSFYFDENTGRVALRVFPNMEFVNDTSLTLIVFPSQNIDTLKVKGRREGRGGVAEKIWYNGEAIWERSSQPPRRFFTFVKTVL